MLLKIVIRFWSSHLCALYKFHTCTPHNTSVMYAPDRREACAGQFMSVPGLQFSLRKIVVTGDIHGPLLHQFSQPTWAKTSRSPKKPPQPYVGPSPRSSFTQMHRRSHPASSREEPSGLPYRRTPTPSMCPKHSLRPPPPNPPQRWPLGAAK